MNLWTESAKRKKSKKLKIIIGYLQKIIILSINTERNHYYARSR